MDSQDSSHPVTDPSADQIKLPSARERALAENLDKDQVQPPLSLSFTPAPIQVTKASVNNSTSSSQDDEEYTSVNLATLSELSFTPLPLSTLKRESKVSLFPPPKNQFEFDRSKHDFQTFVEEDLPSPLKVKKRISDDPSSHHPNRINEAKVESNLSEDVDFDRLLAGLDIDDEMIHELETEIDLPALDISHSHDQVVDLSSTNDEHRSFTPNESSLLAEDEDALNHDFEEAFVAIQTPIFGLNPLTSQTESSEPTSDEVYTDSEEPLPRSLPNVAGVYLGQVYELNWRQVQALDQEQALGIELLDLTELYIQSGQVELAHDQLAIALLSPKPAITVRYMNAFLLAQLGQHFEACQALKSIYLSLEKNQIDTHPHSVKELLTKWAVYCQQYDMSSKDLSYILSEANQLSPEFAKTLSQTLQIETND